MRAADLEVVKMMADPSVALLKVAAQLIADTSMEKMLGRKPKIK
jgi:hypothetical protein